MTRSAGPLFACALALVSAQANAQAGATPPQPAVPVEPQPPAANPPTADDICRTLEQAAAENGLPVEFFARVIWQESRFNARAMSPKGASGIAQFMPQTASWHGLADPFDPIEALRHSAGYLRELRDRFGNLGLAAAAYNAGPGRVSAWLASHHPLPDETRNYVAIVTGWTADEWASSSPPVTHHSAGRTLYSARQSNLGSEGGGETNRHLHTALGDMAGSPSGGEQGLGDVP
jgi:soluble lytic murein transglycosylase-like protein